MPSHIYYIAEYILKNKISIHIDLVELTGESSSKKQIEVIKNAFGCKVLNRYGLAEAGIVSYTSDDDHCMNIISRHTYVELTEEGEIVIRIKNCQHLKNIATNNWKDSSNMQTQ